MSRSRRSGLSFAATTTCGSSRCAALALLVAGLAPSAALAHGEPRSGHTHADGEPATAKGDGPESDAPKSGEGEPATRKVDATGQDANAGAGSTASTTGAPSSGEATATIGEPPHAHSTYHGIPETTWRLSATKFENHSAFAPKHFLFELRFGAYSPRIDDEFNGSATPFADYFGTSPQFYFGLEADWLPVRVPYLGSVGIAYGWGRVKAEGQAKTSTGAAGSETSLLVTPMYAAAVLRGDWLLREAHVPIVPYVKAGVGVGMWRATGPGGTSSFDGVTGEGTTVGLHLAVGGSLSLTAFDRHTAMAMRAETGIQQAYVWGEWMLANLDGFGAADAMRVGTSTGVGGLAIEY